MSVKFKSDRAADKALKRTSVSLVEQLDLFDTTLHLHAMNGLTALETEKLGNHHETKLERKWYLLTNIIPSKGQYKGMKMLMRALRKTEQLDVLTLLEKTYNEEVDAIIAKKLEVKHKTGENYPIQATASDCGDSITSAVLSDSSLVYKDSRKRRRNLDIPTGSNSSSSDDDDDEENDVISLDSPVEQQSEARQDISLPNPSVKQQSQSESPYVKVMLPDSGTTTVTVMSSPHRPRANHVSHSSNPRKAKQPAQNASVIINSEPENSNTGAANNIKHGTDTLWSVHQLKFDFPVMEFVFVGDAATGKTSLLERYINNKFSIDSKSTIGVEFKSIELTCHNTTYKLHLRDTAGEEKFRSVANIFYRDAVGGFVVYDVTERTSLDHCLQWKKDIDDVVQLLNGDPIPILLIANKIDCGQLDGEQFSKENGFAGYFETSAKTGVGVEEAIHFMVKKVHELSCAHQEPVVRTLSRRDRAMSIKLKFNQLQDESSSKKKCCWHR